jgi:hypothetical protein
MLNTYLVESRFWALKCDVPEEQIVVVFKADARTQVVIVSNIYKRGLETRQK